MRGRFSAFGRAPLTTLIFVVDIALYLVCAAQSGDFGAISGQVNYDLGASVPEGLWDGQWLRLIAPNFLHGGLLHIAVNLISLRALGPTTEEHFGSANFGSIYMLSGVLGFCASQMLGGHLAIGASAALFGMLGAGLVAMALSAPTWKGVYYHPGVRNYLFWIVLNLVIGFSLPGIDNFAHMGGLLAGMIFGAAFEWEQRRKPFAHVAIIAALLLAASVICCARWTFYSPSYHLYVAARAQEEDHDPALAEQEFQQALVWGKFWREDATVQDAIDLYRAGKWDLQFARTRGMSQFMSVLKRYERSRAREPGGAS